MAKSTQPAYPYIQEIGNLTFLPSKVNSSIQDMEWEDKKEIYEYLSSHQKETPPLSKYKDGRLLPPGVREYLAAPDSQTLAHLHNLTLQAGWGEAEIKNPDL